MKELVTKTIIETVENHNLPVNNRINHEIAAIQEIHFYMVSVLWCVTGDNIIFSPVTLKSYRANISSPSYNVSETNGTRLDSVTLPHSLLHLPCRTFIGCNVEQTHAVLTMVFLVALFESHLMN